MARLVIGSCGGLTGLYLSKLFRSSTALRNADIELWGIDADSAFATAQYLDFFYRCPNTINHDEFVHFLISFFNANKIDYYLPTHSMETIVISEYENHIRNSCGTKFIISPFATYQKLDNKRICSQALAKINLNAPYIYQNDSEIIFPAFMKPASGSGSMNAFVVYNAKEYEFHKQRDSSLFAMEYLKGDEYTVDAVFDNDGKLISYNQRVRIKQQGGATVYTRNDFSVDVYGDLVQIANNYTCKGVINIQFFKSQNTIYYTDVNLRYASGGLPLSVESGINLPELLIKLMDGEFVEPEQYQPDRKRRVMYRFYDERFEIL